MKKIIPLLLLVIFIAGCSLDDKKWTVENNIITDATGTVLSGEQNQSPVNPYPSYDDSGELLSGELLGSGKYSTLTLSGGVLNYDNIFTLEIDANDYNHWDYYANQDLLSGTYTESWFINVQNQQRHNVIKIKKPDSDLDYILSDNASDEEKCSLSRDEGQTIIKPLKKEKNGQSYYVIEEKFTSPSMEEGASATHNYQLNLCFVKNDIVYTLIVGNSDGYKKDIINSIQFL